MTKTNEIYTGRMATVAFAEAVLREVNGAPMTDNHKDILSNDPRQTLQTPSQDDNSSLNFEEPTCSYCC